MDDIETRESLRPWDEPGGCLLIGQAVSGIRGGASVVWALVRNVWTCTPMGRPASGAVLSCGWSLEPEPQAAGTVRGSVAMRVQGWTVS